jgi:hypothetical protein
LALFNPKQDSKLTSLFNSPTSRLFLYFSVYFFSVNKMLVEATREAAAMFSSMGTVNMPNEQSIAKSGRSPNMESLG